MPYEVIHRVPCCKRSRGHQTFILRLWAIGLLTLSLVGAAVDRSFCGPASGNTPDGSQASAIAPNPTFADNCRCHGPMAGGAFGPKIAGINLTRAQFTTIVRSGRGHMPAFTTDRVSDEDLAGIYQWLESLKPRGDIGSAARPAHVVAKLPERAAQAKATTAAGHAPALAATAFPSHCAMCHGPAAAGAFGPKLAGMPLSLDAFHQIVRNGRNHMPAFSTDRLTDVQLSQVYAALRGMGSASAPPGQTVVATKRQSPQPRPIAPTPVTTQAPGRKLAATVLGAGSPAASSAPPSSAPPSSAPSGANAAVTKGGEIFAQLCSSCHGAGASGGLGPRLAGINLPFAQVHGIVRSGMGAMPSFSPGAVPDATLKLIYAYLTQPGGAQSGGGQGPLPSMAPGSTAGATPLPVGGGMKSGILGSMFGRVYAVSCAGCHGANAQEGLAPRLENTDMSLEEFQQTVRNGKGVMPAFPSSRLADGDLAGIYLLLTRGPAGTVSAQSTAVTPPPDESELLAAKRVNRPFATICAGCHGASATGGFGPALLHTTLSFATFQSTVRHGKQQMPKFSKSVVTDADLVSIYHFLTQSSLSPADLPLTYTLAKVVTWPRVARGLLVVFVAGLVLTLVETRRWMRRAGWDDIAPQLHRLGIGRTLKIGFGGMIVDGFLAGWLYGRDRLQWALHEILLYLVPILPVAAILLATYETSRSHSLPAHSVTVASVVLGIVVVVAALYVRRVYSGMDSLRRGAAFGIDYMFLQLLILTVAAGFLAAAAHFHSDISWDEPTHVVHLALVAVLLLLAPWTTFAHAFIIPVLAGVTRLRLALTASGVSLPPRAELSGEDGQSVSALSETVLAGLDPSFRESLLSAVS